MGRHKTTYKAIPTKVNGINYRSRLEGKWAAFFEVLRWHAEYEPDLQAGYVIPDFLMVGWDFPTIIECKPAVTPGELASERAALVGKMPAWLRDGVEHELARLDGTDEPLELTDLALDDLARVERGANPHGGARRILVVGPSLHAHHTEDTVTLDGEHGFTLCTNGDDADHVGLSRATGAACLLCGREATAWMPQDLIMEEWRAVGNQVQWRAVTPE